jgi:hypothetical protein
MTVEELETLHKQTFETNNANEDALKQFSVELEKLQAEVEGFPFSSVHFKILSVPSFSIPIAILVQPRSAMPANVLAWSRR